MRPIKQLQQATHFKKVSKGELINELKGDLQNSSEDIDEEEEDLNSSVWMPVILDKIDKA